MEKTDDIIYQGEFYKLNESRKRLIGTKSDSWKSKYLLFYHKGEKPVLEYHKKKPKNGKKPERTLTDSFELWPSYKVEKLLNARGRAFVCEITSSDFHIFLSADEERQIDILVFLLQMQIRLKDNIKKEIISVVPDDSEYQHRIGASGSRCVLHASPWGLTLVLEQTRCLLAQWPLKSIRYYETSGAGNFSIEAGRVAPMGEGLFSFKTQSGEDDTMYDLVDNYIINTLDRVKPTQKGTPEEIEDYIREHDCLHSLTAISICSPRNLEIRSVLKRNWNISLPAPGEDFTSGSVSQGHSPRHRGRSAQDSHVAFTSSIRPIQSSSLVINLDRPGESRDSRRSSAEHHATEGLSPDDSRVTVRPPPLPSRSTNNGGVPRRSQRRDHSIPRKVDVAGTKLEGGTRLVVSESILPGSSKSHSNSSNVIHKVDNSGSDVAVNTSSVESGNPHHTEFYNLSSPNMKVRISKSPIITRNPNKVGRAEYFLSKQHSGIKSSVSVDDGWGLKSTVEEEDGREAAKYVDAVSRTSQKRYGGRSSAEPSLFRLRRDLSTSDQSTNSDYSYMENPGDSLSLTRPRGYVNLPNTPSREIHHGRQMSAPETVSKPSTPEDSRQSSRDGEQTLSPPTVRQKKRNGDAVNEVSSGSRLAPVATPGSRPTSAGNTSRRSAESAYPDSVNSVRPHGRSSDILDSNVVRNEQNSERKLSVFSGLENVDEPVGDWLMSASCEDLSDHMRTVIYDDNDNSSNHETTDNFEEIDSVKAESSLPVVSPSGCASASDKPPLPFIGLKKFHDHTDAVNYSRDRSKSFGYMNISGGVTPAAQTKPQSSAPSAHLIRKMVNARSKQEALRKSLSNPNFLNLGSKEHLFNLKTTSGSAARLAPQHKQKSKSFGSLFPAIKKALSRESLGHSRSTTPERRNSRSTTPERRSSFSARRSSNDADSTFKRQTSFHSYGEMSIKGIRMTERSRSFRRVRCAKSLEILSNTNDENGINRLSSATTVSSPAAADLVIQNSADNANMSSMSEPPSSDKSAGNPTTAQITQAGPSLPPVPTTLQSPPPLTPQDKSSEDDSPFNTQMKKSISNTSGIDESLPNQNTFNNELGKMSTHDRRKSKRPVISESIEVTSAELNLRHHKQIKPHFTESVSDNIDSQSHRISSTDQSAQGSRISGSLQRTSSSHVTAPSNNRTTDSGDLKSEHPRSEHSSKTSDQKELKCRTGSQRLEANPNQSNVTNGGDSYVLQLPLDESKSKIIHTLPSPFQPIPFNKQQNGIHPVHPPTRPSKPCL